MLGDKNDNSALRMKQVKTRYNLSVEMSFKGGDLKDDSEASILHITFFFISFFKFRIITSEFPSSTPLGDIKTRT